MKPSQLPTASNKYFTIENDYRFLLSGLSQDLHGVVHLRQPAKAEVKAAEKLSRFVKRLVPDDNYLLEREISKINRFDHFAIAVDKNGNCYVGRADVNPSDDYRRRFGFRLAVLKSLQAMNAGAADFSIGVEPPDGKDLNDMVIIKLQQFGKLGIF